MNLPEPRGPISEAVIRCIAEGGYDLALPDGDLPAGDAVLGHDDLQLALYVAYELHYRGFDDAPRDMEWDPGVLALRATLERAFHDALAEVVPERIDVDPQGVGAVLFDLAAADDAPSVAKHLGAGGTEEQFREFAMHRSAYQLKEADPHSWAIPRLDGGAKAALLEVQFDEYGSGDADRIHAVLFARAMEAMGLDATYGTYVDRLPGITLANVNLMTMFGLQRRWRGAIVGHLAIFEMTSAEPSRRIANGLRRLGIEGATDFFDEHVEADSIHENIAAYDLAGGLAKQEPELTASILFGAECLLEMEGRWSRHLLDSWEQGESSLLPGPQPVTA